MHIRPLTPLDAAAFQELRLRGLAECPSAFASSYAEEAEASIQDVARRLEPKPDGALFGAFQEASLLGMVGVQREPMRKLAHKAIVWGMYVAPEARQRGIGAALMRHALEYAASELRVHQVNLGVNTENSPAVALYRKLGFTEYGLERRYLLVDGAPHDQYHMVCRVQSEP